MKYSEERSDWADSLQNIIMNCLQGQLEMVLVHTIVLNIVKKMSN